MATRVASLFADLSIRDNATAALGGFEGTLNRAGEKLTSLGNNVRGFGTTLVTTFGPFAALFGLSFNKFSSFEEAMRNAHSILGTMPGDMEDLNDQILEIGSNSRAGPQAAAEAFYNIVSGVQDATTHMDILQSAIATSEAGNADLMATTSVMVGIMNAYGFAAEDASTVSDTLTRSVQMGVLTMDELAGAMPNVTGLAGTLGIGLDEISGALSFLTTKGFSASVASTQLRASMTALVNPNETMKKALEELGYASGEAIIEQLGLVGALDAIASTSVVAEEGLAKTVGSTEAYNAALQLTTDAADAFMTKFAGMGEMMGGVEFEGFRFGGSGAAAAQEWLDSQGGIEGATDAAREIQMDGPAAQIDLLKSKVDELAIVIGESLVPALTDIMDKVEPVVEDFTEWAEKNPELVSSVGLLVGGLTLLGLVLIPIGSLLSVSGALVSGLGALAGFLPTVATGVTGFATALAPLLLPAALLGGIVAAYVTDFGGFKTKINETGEAIRSGDVAGAIQGVAESMLAIPLGLATEFGDLIGIDVPGGLAAWEPVISGIAGGVSNLATGAKDAAANLLGLAQSAPNLSNFVDTATTMAGNAGNQSPWGNERRQPVWDPSTRDSGGVGIAGGAYMIGTGAQPEMFMPTTSGMFVPNIDEMFGNGGGGNVTVIQVNNPQFNGVQDVPAFYDAMEREKNRRAPMGVG